MTPGLHFGKLTTVRRSHSDRGQPHWLCRCVCGTEKVVRTAHLRYGRVQSCGCYRGALTRARSLTHGHTVGGYKRHPPEYRIWQGMKRRCDTPTVHGYPNYGGRGIRVCDRWCHDFTAFYADVGQRPSPRHSLDRINNDGHYEPGNVRWATWSQQALNRRPRKAK